MLWAYSWFEVQINGNKYTNRKEWKPLDATLLSEGIFSIATVLAFCKLFYFFQTGHALGPLIVSPERYSPLIRDLTGYLEKLFCTYAESLQVSFSRMFTDIMHFMQIYLCVLVSFSLGMARLYYYYKGQVRRSRGETEAQSSLFLGYVTSFSGSTGCSRLCRCCGRARPCPHCTAYPLTAYTTNRTALTQISL